MNRHNHHEGLTGEHRFGDTGQLILACIFIIIWTLDSFIFQYTTFLSQDIPLLFRVIISIPVFYTAYRFSSRSFALVFGGKGDPTNVLEEDVFAIMRHPMYFAAILIYAGFFLLTLSLTALAIGIIASLFYNYLARHEEGLLCKRFGQAYEDYMKRVPRWIKPFQRIK